MRRRFMVAFVGVLCLVWPSLSWAVEVAPRITDREIIEGLAELRGDLKRIEAGQRTIQKQVDDVRKEVNDVRKEVNDVRKEVDDVRKQVDDARKELKGFMMWGFGLIFVGMFTLVGFVLWDRRSTLSPAMTRLRQLEEHEARLERALKELAQRDPNVADALRHVGLL